MTILAVNRGREEIRCCSHISSSTADTVLAKILGADSVYCTPVPFLDVSGSGTDPSTSMVKLFSITRFEAVWSRLTIGPLPVSFEPV